eukprot:TRINITY_DN25335_c0_g1_i1.p1 TRINITY_DN25335_c0_g1~~TRINITY_DN25335_c0_g1_i1.p1  ORF type:complete len:327 (+),score=83.30 TRINITY_DN25335_c0_g1_i1:64-1044(+)
MSTGLASAIDVTEKADYELWRTALVDQWSTPLMDDDSLFSHLGLGKQQEVTHVMRDFREYAVLNELTEQHKRQVLTDAQCGSAIRIQAAARGWLVRRRYQRHRRQLQALLAQLKVSRETEAVTAAQKIVRGFLARWELKRRVEDEERRREEADAKRKKKSRARKPVAASRAPVDTMTRAERLVQREAGFLEGWDYFVQAVEGEDMRTVRKDGGQRRLEEAVRVWERAHKVAPQDVIVKRMIDRAQKLREQERLREQQQRDVEKTAKSPPKGRQQAGSMRIRPSPPSSADSQVSKLPPNAPAGSATAVARRSSQERQRQLGSLPPVG